MYTQPGGALGSVEAGGLVGAVVGTLVAPEQVTLPGFMAFRHVIPEVTPQAIQRSPEPQSSVDIHFSPHTAAGAAILPAQLTKFAALLRSSVDRIPGTTTAATTEAKPMKRTAPNARTLPRVGFFSGCDSKIC